MVNICKFHGNGLHTLWKSFAYFVVIIRELYGNDLHTTW